MLNWAIAAFVTDFNNNGTTMSGNSQPCAVCDGVWHNFFAYPELQSTPIFLVPSSLVNSLTIASESGGSTKPPTTKMADNKNENIVESKNNKNNNIVESKSECNCIVESEAKCNCKCNNRTERK